MHDFAAQIGASVRTSRELRRAHTETLRRKEEGAARRLKEAQQQASALVVTAWELISTAAQASDGALKADRSEQQGVATFMLRWTEDQPVRALQICIDQADGTIQAAWIMPPGYGLSVGAPSVPAAGFDLSNLEAAILLLVEQRRWAHNAIPSIPW
jgi:hypothetical protein